MQMLKKIGPRTNPWGTPQLTLLRSDGYYEHKQIESGQTNNKHSDL